MNERAKEKFNLNMRAIKNCLDCISNDRIASEELVKNEVKIMRNLIKECEELVME